MSNYSIFVCRLLHRPFGQIGRRSSVWIWSCQSWGSQVGYTSGEIIFLFLNHPLLIYQLQVNKDNWIFFCNFFSSYKICNCYLVFSSTLNFGFCIQIEINIFNLKTFALIEWHSNIKTWLLDANFCTFHFWQDVFIINF